MRNHLLYFFAYKRGFFPFKNNCTDLDPSYKTFLDFLAFRKRKKNLIAELRMTDLYICGNFGKINQNNLKYLDSSYKTDLDLCDCFGNRKIL